MQSAAKDSEECRLKPRPQSEDDLPRAEERIGLTVVRIGAGSAGIFWAIGIALNRSTDFVHFIDVEGRLLELIKSLRRMP